MRRRDGDDRDIEPLTARDFLELLDVENRDSPARLAADFLVGRVEERRNLEALLPEPRIVREGEAEIAGAHDRDAQAPIETEDLAQVPAEILDVVAHPPHAEFTEVREVLANLRGV